MSKWSIQVTSENAIARNLGVPEPALVRRGRLRRRRGLRRRRPRGRRHRGRHGALRPGLPLAQPRLGRAAVGRHVARARPRRRQRATRPPSSRRTASCGRSIRWRCSRAASCTIAATRRGTSAGSRSARASTPRNNPVAMMREPMTLEDHAQLAHHLRPAAAVRQLPRDRRRRRGDRRRRGAGARLPAEAGVHPCRVAGHGAAQLHHEQLLQGSRSSSRPARTRRATSGAWRACGPQDVDVAQLYDAFTPLVLASLEEYGFCKPGEAGALRRERRPRGGRAACPTTPAAAACRRRTCTAST